MCYLQYQFDYTDLERIPSLMMVGKRRRTTTSTEYTHDYRERRMSSCEKTPSSSLERQKVERRRKVGRPPKPKAEETGRRDSMDSTCIQEVDRQLREESEDSEEEMDTPTRITLKEEPPKPTRITVKEEPPKPGRITLKIRTSQDQRNAAALESAKPARLHWQDTDSDTDDDDDDDEDDDDDGEADDGPRGQRRRRLPSDGKSKIAGRPPAKMANGVFFIFFLVYPICSHNVLSYLHQGFSGI